MGSNVCISQLGLGESVDEFDSRQQTLIDWYTIAICIKGTEMSWYNRK